MLYGAGSLQTTIDEAQAREILRRGVEPTCIAGKRVLVLTPDATRTSPMPMMFRLIVEELGHVAKSLDFMVALGTHQPMTEEEMLHLFGITAQERASTYAKVGLHNHRWDLPDTLVTVGRLEASEIATLTNGLFHEGVDVVINRAALEHDLIVILGPVFPHEVAGFSGGHKYLFPGISGGQLLHYTHWLGAVVTCWETIGIQDTPVRRAIERAAALVPTPRRLLAMVVRPDAALAGLWAGEVEPAWNAATELSCQLHIRRVPKPFHAVLGTASTMYDELWVAGKVMYKLEPVVADGGRLIIHGKHITHVSRTWGQDIERIGYHVRDYFLGRMDQFQDIPLGVLAHSTHVRGVGTFEHGVERPRIDVILATSIPEDVCRRINLGYMDPDTIHLEDYTGKEDQGILRVDKAGEILYRLEADKR